MNGDKSIANDVRPKASLNISAIWETEESVSGIQQQLQQYDVQEQVEDMDQESMVPQQVPNVSQPTQQEVEEHNKTHLNFRNWCPHCVKGKSVERNFAASEHEPTSLPSSVLTTCSWVKRTRMVQPP